MDWLALKALLTGALCGLALAAGLIGWQVWLSARSRRMSSWMYARSLCRSPHALYPQHYPEYPPEVVVEAPTNRGVVVVTSLDVPAPLHGWISRRALRQHLQAEVEWRAARINLLARWIPVQTRIDDRTYHALIEQASTRCRLHGQGDADRRAAQIARLLVRPEPPGPPSDPRRIWTAPTPDEQHLWNSARDAAGLDAPEDRVLGIWRDLVHALDTRGLPPPPPRDGALAARMAAQGHTWAYIARYCGFESAAAAAAAAQEGQNL